MTEFFRTTTVADVLTSPDGEESAAVLRMAGARG